MKLLFIFVLVLLRHTYATNCSEPLSERENNNDSIKIAHIYEKASRYFYNNTDSSRILAREGIRLSQKKSLRYQEADGYFYTAISYNIDNEFDSAKYYYKKCLQIFKEIKADKACAAALNNLGELCFKNGKHNDAYNAYIESLHFYTKIAHKEGIARNYFNISIVHKLKGNYQMATDYLFKALSVFEQTNDTLKRALTLQEIGNIHLQQKKYSTSRDYYQKAIDAILFSNSIYKNSIIAGLKNNIAIIYKRTGNFDNAINTYNEALSIHQKINNKNGIANVYLNLGEIYNQLKIFDKAFNYNTLSLNISKQIEDPYLLAYAIYNRGSIYRGIKSYNNALNLFHNALAKAKKINDKELEKNISEELSLTYETQKDYKNAFLYHKNFKTIQDSLFNEETTRKITTLELQYDFDKKQRKQEFIQKQKETEFQEKINRQQIVIKSSIILSSLLLLLLFTGFGYYRNRQIAKMRTLEIELNKNIQQLLSQQMNPHFIFNCLNSIRNLIIENKTEDTDKYFVTFANLMRNNLEYSQHQAIPIKDEINALQLYVSLEQLRFKKKFKYIIHIDEEIDQYNFKIPSLLLQPFVENAIIHGIRDKEDGEITVSLLLKEKEILSIIDDNGIGRKCEQLSNNNHKSYGTHLTRKRLELLYQLYGKASKLVIIDKKDDKGLPVGTRIEFGIPLII